MNAIRMLLAVLPFSLILVLATFEISGGASLEEVVRGLERLGREQRFQQQIEGAKREKKLVVYTSTQAAETQERVNAFKKKYPFITEVDSYRSSQHRILTRLTTESRAKRYLADVVDMNGSTIHLVKKEGLLGRYPSMEGDLLPKGFKDPDSYWAAENIRPYVLEYSSRLVPRQGVPRKLVDLLNDAWKGKLALDEREYVWFANILNVLGERKGLDFMKRLARQGINLRGGHSLLSQLVAAGEFPINIVQYAHIAQRSIRAGAPVDWVGLDPVITDFHSIALMANAPHPYTATLYIDFALSEEGQRLLARRGFIPARVGVGSDPPRLTTDLKLVPMDLKLLDDLQRYTQLFEETFSKKSRGSRK
ncbi:MAG: ABC transporter substrate-binding protein [Deltaproteobacteria bacterium]|nr:ABC transporter substrate-binding protein [Deltaproteobacteria bacterium]